MSQNETPNENAPESSEELNEVEKLFLAYAMAKSDTEQNEIVELIDEKLNVAKQKGHDIEPYWDRFDKLMKSATAAQYPEIFELIQKEVRERAKKRN